MGVVALVAFALFRYVGDPVLSMLGQDATPEQRVQVTQALGLDQPFYIQFGHFIGNAVQGEFGVSLRQGQKVSSLLAEKLPATLELALTAAAIALLAGVPMGVYTALRRRGVLSNMLLALSLGVEIAAMIGAASKSVMKFFRPATCGGFGVVAGLGSMEGLSADTMMHAFGIQYGQTSGTMQAHVEGSLLLGLQVGVL